MQNNSQRKHIGNWSALGSKILDIDYLRRNKPWGPTSCIDIFLLIAECSQTKVKDDNISIDFAGPKHDILWLEVTVNNVLPGHFRRTAQQTLHDILNLLQCKLVLLDNAEQLAPLEKIQHKIN
jgi:hypothetical protein